MGLGKTAATVVAYAYMKNKKPNLKAVVLTEKMALRQWEEEIKRFTANISSRVITTQTHTNIPSRKAALLRRECDVLITTYSLMYKYAEEVVPEGEWVFILDEPTCFKSEKSLIYEAVNSVTNPRGPMKKYITHVREVPVPSSSEKVLMKVSEFVPFRNKEKAPPSRVYGLTASIVENNLDEAYNIAKVIVPHCVPRRHSDFKWAYIVYHKDGNYRKAVGYKNIDVFRKKLASGYFGRLVTDPEVRQEIPEVETHNVQVELTDLQCKFLDAPQFIDELRSTSYEGILPELLYEQQICDHLGTLTTHQDSPKEQALLDLLKGPLAGNRLVVFSKLRRVVDLFEKTLKREGIPVSRITGKESDRQRESAKEWFMKDSGPPTRVLMGTSAICRAVNLQAGSAIVMIDLPWSGGIYRQLVGRIRRTGSKHPRVHVYRLVAVRPPNFSGAVGHTIDDHAISVIERKLKLWEDFSDEHAINASVSTGTVKEIYEQRARYREAA